MLPVVCFLLLGKVNKVIPQVGVACCLFLIISLMLEVWGINETLEMFVSFQQDYIYLPQDI
jgi:hypothetical protein